MQCQFLPHGAFYKQAREAGKGQSSQGTQLPPPVCTDCAEGTKGTLKKALALHHSPWTEQSASPSLPPSSPHRLAPRRRTGWSCKGYAGRSRAWLCHCGYSACHCETTALGGSAQHLWTRTHRGRLHNGTDGTESGKRRLILERCLKTYECMCVTVSSYLLREPVVIQNHLVLRNKASVSRNHWIQAGWGRKKQISLQ